MGSELTLLSWLSMMGFWARKSRRTALVAVELMPRMAMLGCAAVITSMTVMKRMVLVLLSMFI